MYNGQTRVASAVEAIANVATGFVVALLVSYVVYPMYGWAPTEGTILQLTIIFTTTSVIRSYLWRRFFNWITIKWGK